MKQVLFSPDNSQILAIDSEGKIIIWSKNKYNSEYSQDLQLSAVFNNTKLRFSYACFSPALDKGGQILAIDSEGKIIIWSKNKYNSEYSQIYNFPQYLIILNYAFPMRFSPALDKGGQILAIDSEGKLHRWIERRSIKNDIESRNIEKADLESPFNHVIKQVLFSPDNSQILAIDSEGKIIIWSKNKYNSEFHKSTTFRSI